MTSARRLAPEKVTRCAAEGVPAQEEKAVSGPVSETEGADPTVTVIVAVGFVVTGTLPHTAANAVASNQQRAAAVAPVVEGRF